ncbi:undecaprenyl diphosphate synthase [Flexibacter flexilis DSM 6793]|uniref:Isoprenyl transferase n=2 Tax=Flexibacter flexilis TaxID=998 RepID=A0A1I1L5E7_9BACT|nr:undecaprenyl diphosphate synthase [Flexibacter flexilis DSM 6793]
MDEIFTMDLKEQIKTEILPQHIAVIMDGNGRWAKKQGAMRVFGHRNAIQSVRETAEGCAELGVKFLTLYAFSTENWNRPAIEVEALMQLLVSTIRSETKTLTKNNIRLATIGDTSGLPKSCQKELAEAMEETKDNTRMTLTLALNYGGRWELVEAAKRIAQMAADGQIKPEQVSEQLINSLLATHDMPDPDLLIRTSGELRISNFLLWQLAYSEIYITDVLWPDFRKKDLHEAIIAYQQRERRFGKVLS